MQGLLSIYIFISNLYTCTIELFDEVVRECGKADKTGYLALIRCYSDAADTGEYAIKLISPRSFMILMSDMRTLILSHFYTCVLPMIAHVDLFLYIWLQTERKKYLRNCSKSKILSLVYATSK